MVGARPAAGDAVARDQSVVHHPHLGPERLAVVIVDAVLEVDNDMSVSSLREGVTMNADPLGGRHLRADAIVRQCHGIVSGHACFAVVAEAAAIPSVRIRRRAGIQPDRAGPGHHEDVTEVGMAGAAEMRMAEAYDGRVAVLVSGTVFIHEGLILAVHVVRDRVVVRAELYDAEGCAGPREGMAHAVGADDGVDIVDGALGGRRDRRHGQHQRGEDNKGDGCVLHTHKYNEKRRWRKCLFSRKCLIFLQRLCGIVLLPSG